MLRRMLIGLFVLVLVGSLVGIAVAQTPVKGGILKLRVPRELTLPHLPPYAQAGGPELSWPIFQTLVWLDSDTLTYTGCLAKSWDTTDFQHWTIHLRQGVKWQDGQPFTARDVAFSFNLVANPAVPAIQMYAIDMIEGYQDYQAGKANGLAGVKIIDDYTVQITLTKPDPQFLLTMARVPMLPAHLLANLPVAQNMQWDFWNHPIGTGPFEFAKKVPGEYIQFDRFPGYWRGEPYLDSIVFRVYKEKGPFLIDLHAGRIDGSSLIYPFTLTDSERQAIINDPNLTYIKKPGFTTRGLVFNTNRLPNTEIRKALVMALNIPELDKIIGTVDPSRSAFAQPQFRNPSVEHNFVYDPKQARNILEQQGWDFSRTLNVVTYYTTKPYRDLLAAVQAYWAQIGVKSTVSCVSVPVFVDTWYKKKAADVLWAGFGQLPGFPSCVQNFWSSQDMYPAGGNIGYSNPVADCLLNGMAQTTNLKDKVALAQYFDKFAYSQYYRVVFYTSVVEAVINKRVHNFRPWLTVLAMDMKIYQWWMEPQTK